jgi:hypothetical protein
VELVPPRIETPRPSRVTGSYGAEAAAWIRFYLGDELRPWQRYALERILEHDESGELVWKRVILSVARQSGKSVLARGLCGWRLGAADVFGDRQNVLHVANLRSTAANIWKPAARELEQTAGAVVRRANGQEAIELGDGGSWRLAASTLDAGVGDSNDLAFCDEAWRLTRDVVDGSIAPTLIERASSQLVLVSTAGDGGSTMLLEDRAAAIAQAADGETARILILEWSSAPEREDGDRDGWREASPHWTPRRVAALDHAYSLAQSVTGDPIEDRKRRLVWHRQYLNRWVDEHDSAWISGPQWDAGGRTELDLPPSPAGTVAIEHHVAGFPFGAVLAVADELGEVTVAARVFDRRRELWLWIDELARSRRGLELLHPPQYKGHVPSSIRATAKQVGTAEQYAGYGPTVAAAFEGRILHDGDAELRRQVLAAGTVRTPDRGTALSSKHSTGPIYLTRALVWAVAHELRPDRGRRPLVVGGRRS